MILFCDPKKGKRKFTEFIILNKEEEEEEEKYKHEASSMVSSAQNVDRQNGHVLVENQQTRLEPDNEATSKSKVYRAHICLRSYKEGESSSAKLW